MRLLALDVSGVGGIPDGRIDLPSGPVAALAGANGTGKSKLLACLLSPWSQTVPAPRSGEAASVSVEFRLATSERDAIAQLSETAGWGSVKIPEIVSVRTVEQPLIGRQRSTDPSMTVLREMWTMAPFLQAESSLNIIYLPAERRLLPPNQAGIDLQQLSEQIAWQKNAESRNSAQSYGRLDDQEFEQFAKALCVSATLPSEEEGVESSTSSMKGRIQWPEFRETVDSLIAPKHLLPLTQKHPEHLRVRTPGGHTHAVQELSSGERQALIIISRVLRAGAGHTVVLIDEPDAYLHPHLSQRLLHALERGVGPDGQLIVATHSPAILDGIAPNAILRMGHEEAPRLVANESERVELYRGAGFRASALTQSDLLIITEGESDAALLSLNFPSLTRAAIRSAGGRERVLRAVGQLSPYEIPVLGVVDRDVGAPESAEGVIVVWPTADIEGNYLADDITLQVMFEKGFIKSSIESIDALREILNRLLVSLKENVVAELAQKALRNVDANTWPTPKGDNAVGRLRASVARMSVIKESDIDDAIGRAEALWSAHEENLWALVRGKYVLNDFAGRATEIRSGRALLEAVARTRPQLAGFGEFSTRIDAALGAATSQI